MKIVLTKPSKYGTTEYTRVLNIHIFISNEDKQLETVCDGGMRVKVTYHDFWVWRKPGVLKEKNDFIRQQQIRSDDRETINNEKSDIKGVCK